MFFDFAILAVQLWPGIDIFVELCIAVALVLGFVRVVKGPDHADRVVVLDFITGAFICLVLFHAIEQRSSLYLAVALFLAVISFLGTVALARYLFNRRRQRRPHA
ncbi:MAG: monovalent cation/H+ antiporter complex subunit F [Opitutales bacterium]